MSFLGLDDRPAPAPDDSIDDELASIPTYLIPSVVSLVFCCLPGLVAVFFSVKTVLEKRNLNVASARMWSGRAKIVMYWAFILGILTFISQLIVRLNNGGR